MFQYNQNKWNKKLIIIFTVIFCIVGGLIGILGVNTFVTVMWILFAIVGYIAYVKFRLYGTTLTGENLLKREPIDLVNLNINATKYRQGMTEQDQYSKAYKIISQADRQWQEHSTERDYLKDRDAFYSFLKHQILMDWIKAGEDKSVFLNTMIQYARDDWVNSGRNAKEFEQRLSAVKKQ